MKYGVVADAAVILSKDTRASRNGKFIDSKIAKALSLKSNEVGISKLTPGSLHL